MYVITYKGKPATLRQLCERAENVSPYWLSTLNETDYIDGPNPQVTKQKYLAFFGFTWRERTKGIECQKVAVDFAPRVRSSLVRPSAGVRLPAGVRIAHRGSAKHSNKIVYRDDGEKPQIYEDQYGNARWSDTNQRVERD